MPLMSAPDFRAVIPMACGNVAGLRLYPSAAYTGAYPHPDEAYTSLSYPSERILPCTISSLTVLTGVSASCRENDPIFVSDSIILD